jgi:hypothetical protein
MKRTEELLNERIRQVETTLAQLRRINHILEEYETLAHSNINAKS